MENKLIFQVNKLQNNGNIWTVDETIFNPDTKLFMAVNLKTRHILGYILNQDKIESDLLIEFYSQMFENYSNNCPVVIHSDNEPAFINEKVKKFLSSQEPKVEVSSTLGGKHQNQVSEAINESIKALITKICIRDSNNAKGFKEWRQTIPKELKYLSTNAKSKNIQFRKLLFQSNFFKQNKINLIKSVLSEYNQTEFTPGISRQKAEYYNSKLEPKDLENIQLVSSKDLMALKIKKENAESIKKVEKELSQIIKSNIKSDEKINRIASLILEGHSEASFSLITCYRYSYSY